MSYYGDYDAPPRERSSRHYYEERRDDRDRGARYESRDYLAVEPRNRELVRRGREDSDLSVEEIHRDFPPPGYSRDIRRARSAEPGGGYYGYDDARSVYTRDYDDRDRGYDRRASKKATSIHYEEEERKHARMLTKQQKIIAALVGGAVAVGGKELYDRREAKKDGHDVDRNLLSSAALGAIGAFATYQGTEFYDKHAAKEEKKSSLVVHRGRDGRVTAEADYYSDEEPESKQKKGHENFLEKALAAAGLGGAVKALTGGKDDDTKSVRSDMRSRRGSRSRSRSPGPANKIQKAAMASLIAGATEAFRVSKEPGGWKGEKAKRIFTAAAGAATIDAAQNPEKSGKLSLAESVIGGLVGNRLVNGSKKNIEEDKKTGRSRSRSRARSEGGGGMSGIAALATAGLAGVAGKKILDNRSKSRERGRSRDSYDSRSPSPRRRSRSRSVADTARRGLAKLGFGKAAEDDRDRDVSPRSRHSVKRYDSYDSYDDEPRGGYGRRKDDYDDDRSYGGRERSRSRGAGARRRRGSRSSRGSDTDLGDSDEDEKQLKKMRDRRH